MMPVGVKPTQRLNVSVEPRPLQLLYSKYAPERRSSPNLTAPLPVSVVRKSRLGRDAQPTFPRRQDLGDLRRKLGRELTKVERVQMYLEMSDKAGVKSKSQSQPQSQPSSSDVNTRCMHHQCRRCSQEPGKDEGKNRIQDIKSKLRLVAARSLPDCGRDRETSPVRSPQASQRVVQLPLLQLNMNLKRNAKSTEDIATFREARQSLRHMFYRTSVSRQAAGAWNYRFANSQPGGRHIAKVGVVPGVGMTPDTRGYTDSSEMSSAQLPSAVPRKNTGETHNKLELFSDTTSSYDADRVDSEQFDYVFDQFSVSSTETGSTLTGAESDAGTYSARAQRPSTTDTIATPQRLVETRASGAPPPSSPVSLRLPSGQRHRAGESWPPQYTVVPSWPALDDPFRFQYRGCSVHRDIMRRLHKSRGKRRKSRKNSDVKQPQTQRLKVVVPSHTNTECAECRLYRQSHQVTTTPCLP